MTANNLTALKTERKEIERQLEELGGPALVLERIVERLQDQRAVTIRAIAREESLATNL